MRKIYAIVIGLILLPLAVVAETLELKSGGGVAARVEVDRHLELVPSPPTRTLGGLLSCGTTPPGHQESSACPVLTATFAARDVVEAPPHLKSMWEAANPTGPEADPPHLWLDQNVLHYASVQAEFVLDIGSFFLPRTRILRQWSAQTIASDVLFVLSKTCDDEQVCRNGLWFFVIPKGDYSSRLLPAFRTSLIPLLAEIDETRLQAGTNLGIFSAAARLAVMLPTEIGTIAVSWVADFESSHGAGLRALHFEISAIPSPPVEP